MPDQRFEHLRFLGSPAVAPDGTRVAVVETRSNHDDDRYDRSIHLWDAESGYRRFTDGPGDTDPVWSPDGRHLAFLRRVGDRPQLAVISADGGEVRIVSDAPGGVGEPRWTDAGLFVRWTESADPPGAEVDPGELARRPRRIERFPYRFDAKGWIHDRRHRITRLDPHGHAAPRHLAPPMRGIDAFDVTADTVVLVAELEDQVVGDDRRAVLAVPIEGGDPVPAGPTGAWQGIVAHSDAIVVFGVADPSRAPASAIAHRVVAHDDAFTSVPLVEGLDRSMATLRGVSTDHGLLVSWEDAGTVSMIRLMDHPYLPRHEVVHGGASVVTGFSADPTGEVVAVTVSEVARPSRLLLIDHGVERELVDPNPDVAVAVPERSTVRGDGGDIDAWVYLPPGDHRVPVLLNIHGGPASQYGDGFFDEFQVYVDAGYAVVACNPRGSSGRGTEWMRAVVGEGWGRHDMADILAVLDDALARHPRLDPARVGVMGGSYGGFMTAWLTGRHHRFASAVVERALISFPSFWGTSDIGPFFTRRYTDGLVMPDDIAALWALSPLAMAHRTVTPTLVLHSEDDFRCPIEQAEQYVMALLGAGVPTRFVRFPGEGHELSRSGSPRHRRERFETILAWHGRWLGVEPAEVPD